MVDTHLGYELPVSKPVSSSLVIIVVLQPLERKRERKSIKKMHLQHQIGTRKKKDIANRPLHQ